jgi:hypothetical protein
MQGEYRTAKGWRIFIYIFSPILITVFIVTGIIPFIFEDSNTTVTILLVVFSLSMIALFSYGLIDAVKGKFVIEQDHLLSVTAFGSRALKFDGIRGYRVDQNYIHIIPIDTHQKKLKVSTYTERSQQITDWLSTRYPELDTLEALEEEKNILDDFSFGMSKQAREYKLGEAKRIAKITNATGFVLFLWITFYPFPYSIAISLGIVYPLLVMVILYLYRGLLRMDERKKSAYPSVVSGFLMAGLGLSLRALMDFNILEYKQLWITIGIAAGLLFILIIALTKLPEFKTWEDYFAIPTIIIVVSSYSFGAYTLANCTYDESVPLYYNSEILDKEMTTGKSTSYYFTVISWHGTNEIEKIKVSADEYSSANAGDHITIYEKEGLFKTPWYFVMLQE